MAITQTFKINVIPNSAPVIVKCDQYDVGEGRFVAQLYKDDTIYTPSAGATAIVQGTKPDGHGFMYDATISTNTVTFDLTEQMSIVAGRVCAQIVLDEGDDRIGTYVFFIDVQKSALPANTDMSASDYQIIEELLETAQAINTNFPYIGANGNWWYWDVETAAYVDSGVDASITITIGTTTTLPAGSSATVTNRGTNTDPILDFGIPKGDKGDTGAAGVGVPSGGSTGQVLKKKSGTDYDTEWGAAPGQGVPTGGTTGQILAKKSSTDYDTEWQNAPSVSDKADKVTGATSGDFAGLDANGNLTDSGKKASDYATAASVTAIEGKIPSSASSSNKMATASDITGVYSVMGENGAKNYLNVTITTATVNGVTWTVNSDKSISTSGTADASTYVDITGNFILPAGSYILSGCAEQSTALDMRLRLTKVSDYSAIAWDDGEGAQFTLGEDTKVVVRIRFEDGVDTTGRTFYPMIRLASDTDNTYQPYAMTNRELTDSVQKLEDCKYHTSSSGTKTVTCTNRYQQFILTIFRGTVRAVYLITQYSNVTTYKELVYITSGQSESDIGITIANISYTQFSITIPDSVQTNIISTEQFTVS